jgi:hypothetical protein
MKKPRQYSLVKLIRYNDYKFFGETNVFVFFGEIPNMPGHTVIYNVDSKQLFHGIHIEDLVELTPEEV